MKIWRVMTSRPRMNALYVEIRVDDPVLSFSR